jgi:hypothetical protein
MTDVHRECFDRVEAGAPEIDPVVWEVARVLCEWERGDELATEVAARLVAFLKRASPGPQTQALGRE